MERIFAALIGDYIVMARVVTWRFRSARWQTITRNPPPPPLATSG